MTSFVKLAALLALIAIPIAEIALLIKAAGVLGFWTVLGIVVLTGILGAHVIRSSGMSALSRAFASIEEGGSGLSALADQALRAAGGVLLLLPGLMGDLIGAALLVPAARLFVRKSFAGALGFGAARAQARQGTGGRDEERLRPRQNDVRRGTGANPPPVIDADYVRLDDEPPEDTGKQ